MEEGFHQALLIKFSHEQIDIQELRKLLPTKLGSQGCCLVRWLALRHRFLRFDRYDDYVLGAAKPKFFHGDLLLLSIMSAVGKPIAIDKATQEKSRPSTTRLPQRMKLQYVDEKFGKIMDHFQKFVYDNCHVIVPFVSTKAVTKADQGDAREILDANFSFVLVPVAKAARAGNEKLEATCHSQAEKFVGENNVSSPNQQRNSLPRINVGNRAVNRDDDERDLVVQLATVAAKPGESVGEEHTSLTDATIGSPIRNTMQQIVASQATNSSARAIVPKEYKRFLPYHWNCWVSIMGIPGSSQCLQGMTTMLRKEQQGVTRALRWADIVDEEEERGLPSIDVAAILGDHLMSFDVESTYHAISKMESHNRVNKIQKNEEKVMNFHPRGGGGRGDLKEKKYVLVGLWNRWKSLKTQKAAPFLSLTFLAIVNMASLFEDRLATKAMKGRLVSPFAIADEAIAFHNADTKLKIYKAIT
ncbi:hypothetical protein H5410_047988 [Solanum commersonii]|uniref:Uncharacterized protein n=1 Tax=Solanum commersonii TaxID=4109 RepID=A0A9J5XIP0_SOLCO|nr:hypothetical protein H5410_047988 [Solanum commersonii]